MVDSVGSAGSDRERVRCFASSNQEEPLLLNGSPFTAAMNPMLIELDAVERKATFRYHPGEHYVAARSVLQGGAIATMLDMSMALLAVALVPREKGVATSGLTLSFLKPAHAGTYTVEAEIDRAGHSLWFANARLILEGGDAVAGATGIFSVFEVKRR